MKSSIKTKEIEVDLSQLIELGGFTLPSTSGIGTVLAAAIIGEVGDIRLVLVMV